jgi:uncharacterized protein
VSDIERSPRRSPVILIGAAVLLLLVFFPAIITFYADILWFQEVGFTRVYTTEIVARIALFATVALLAFAFLYGNARFAQRGRVFNPYVLQGTQGPPLDVTEMVRRFTLPAVLAISFFMGLAATGWWMMVLQAFHGSAFGTADPVFGRDVSFYVFTLPLLSTVLGLLFGLGVLALLITLAAYWFRRDIVLAPTGQLRVEPTAGRHLAGLGAFLFVVTALNIWLVGLPDLLYSTTGPLVGASYSDLNAMLPGMHISAVAALLAAGVLVFYAARLQVARGAIIAVAGYAVVSLLARGAYPAAIQRLVVAPTELTREAPYLQNHITASRAAWGLADVESREITGAQRLTLDDVRANAATVENVRLWDREPLLQTLGQLQEIRTYYDFVSVDDDRYWINGRYRQVLLSARELNAGSLPTRTFINEHLTFTHGMGVSLAPVNQATDEGLPVLFIQDLPPRSNIDLEVTRPQIYYGELTDPHVFVNTLQREFDYPAGDVNVFRAYTGSGGVPVGGVFRRSMLAAYFGQANVLLSRDITGESRVLYNRNIATRARKALPFLRFDADPYLVITPEGRMVWLLDAYTSTTRYPYSVRLGDGTNYMRNSVKVVIDAYDGSIDAYVADPRDPIIRTNARIFPGIFRPMDQMPEGLRAHIRYPSDIYRVQMGLYTIYHMDDPEEFYHREDQWQIPTMQTPAAQARELPFMRRIIMRLPGEEEAEFIYMTPFTPREKDNLTAWVVARNDGEHYGRLMEYRFPRQSLVFGPRQIVSRINQDTEISRQLTLWDQRGSSVIRGELMVIPIEESLIYVQPIYLRAEGGRIPELRRVVVAFENRVVMEETLEAGLSRLFGGQVERRAEALIPGAEPGVPAVLGPDEVAPDPGAPRLPAAVAAPVGAPDPGLPARAREHYDRALEAQRAGDWARYGEEIRRLGDVLREMGAGAGAP